MPPASLPDWALHSHPFTLNHAVSLVWTLSAIIVSCRLGRRWLASGREDLEQKLSAAWGGFAICVNLWSIVYWHLPANFKPEESLPIQLCDLACMFSPLVFLTHWRWPRSLLFFWGIGLSSQAFITPTVTEGPADTKYYLFWLVHLVIVGSAIYDLFVRRFRPTVRDMLFAIAAGIAYVLAMVVVNHFLDSNYGFVGDHLRETTTPVHLLGPWPARIFILGAIGISLFVVLWLAVTFIDRALGGRNGGESGRRKRSGSGLAAPVHCSKCGFDLAEAGRTAEHCPECGTPITSPGV